VVQEIAGVAAAAVLDNVNAATTVGQALRSAIDSFVRRSVNDADGLRVLITAIIDALTGQVTPIGPNHPLNQGARLLGEFRVVARFPLAPAKLRTRRFPLPPTLAAAVAPVAVGGLRAHRALQSGAGFRVQYAIIIPPVNTPEAAPCELRESARAGGLACA